MFPNRKTHPQFDQQKEYWRHKIATIPPLEWITDFRRLPFPSFRRESVIETLDIEAIRELCSVTKQTAEETMLAALKVLLLRYTNQEAICVGCICSDASASGVNLLPVLTDFRSAQNFVEVSRSVMVALAEASDHRDIPFESMIELAGAEQGTNRAPLFQVLFLTQDQENEAESFETLIRCDVVFVFHNSDQPGLACYYDPDLFHHDTIERFLGRFRELFKSILARPQEDIRRLCIMMESEKAMLEEWNNTSKKYPRDLSIPKMFEMQVDIRPQAVALNFNSEVLTYAELNRRSNRVAHFLIHERNLAAESLVGIFMERSMEMIVAMIGILKAGCAYVPLDPDYPRERLEFILNDTNVPVVLTQRRLAERLLATGTWVFCVDDSEEVLNTQPDTNPNVPVHAKNLCYVMYTSGSTGKPKGVLIEHRGVVRIVTADNYVDIHPDDAFLHIISICFDASCTEIWGTLLNGARLVIFPHQKPTIAELEKIITEENLTGIYFTPGLFDRFMETEPKCLLHVRNILTGGDVISVPNANRAIEGMQNGMLFNDYGPTECTDLSTTYKLTSPFTHGVMPIGRPISNTTIHILDSYQQHVPIGIPGEINVGGDGVGRGYLNRPELTSERFWPDPFSSDPEARLYRSGDRGRWLADGNIEFLGRTDHQVKVRGFRIELGEIQHVLKQNADIQKCVVLAIQESEGEKNLVAFLISNKIPSPTVTELRSFLKTRLPDYMIPSYFVLVDSFPMTVGGKIDRKALESLDYKKPVEISGRTGPRSELERTVIQVWCQVLGHKEIGIHDDFFEVGGHSLLAMQILNRISEMFHVELSIRSLFDAPTVASLSAAIASKQKISR